MNYEYFLKEAGSTFAAVSGGREIPLKLTRVERLKPLFPREYAGPKPDFMIETPFSLLFCGPADTVLESRIHVLTNEQGKSCSVFLSAFMQNADGIHYEAIFK